MLLNLIDTQAAAAPDRPLLVHDGGTLTYRDVAVRARELAGALHGAQVSRFGVACATAVDTVLALVASSAIGAEACVYPRCDLANSELIATEFDHDTVLVTAEQPPFARARSFGSLVQRTDVLPVAVDDPVLILTSGTTGRPKGTRHSWSKLLRAAHPVRAGLPTPRWLLAYNLNQYAGIQVLLHVLGSGGTLVIPKSPQPRHAVAAMRTHGVTHVSATPTFWRFAVHMVGAEKQDEIHLEQVTLGGEAVSDTVLADLRRLFPEAQISQVYASSEFGSSVSVTDGRAGLPLSVLDRSSNAPVQFRIMAGELYVRSRIGMRGYHGGGNRDDGWHPTGDLVEVDGDRIQFIGRTTEVINVGGVKVYPLPIESLISTIPDVVAAAVFGHPNPVTGQIVAVDIVASAQADPDELKGKVREVTAHLPSAQRPRRIRIVDELDTSNLKVRRRSGSDAV